MTSFKARRQRHLRAHRAWREKGGTDGFLATLYGNADFDEFHHLSTRTSPTMNLFMGRNPYGARLTYVTELDPGPLDGARAPYDRGGAEAIDVRYL